MSTNPKGSSSNNPSNDDSSNVEIPKPNPTLDRSTTRSDPRPPSTRIITPNNNDKKK
ncbi:MAG TPA: hypothetical protein PLW14_12530 [Chlorobiota bacterium]|nr:hypothetical protein [Chlorobiota bacterium]